MKVRNALAVGAAIALAGCASAPPPPPAPAPVVEAPPAPAPEPAPPPAPVLTGAEAKTRAQTLIRQSYDSLNDGDEARARADLQEAMKLDPDSKQAACLMKGITADPVATLGRDSTTYTVRPGETMGRIAQRALGDLCEFYLLARYNQIKVPKQLAAGQTLRIPGKVALAAPDAAPARPGSDKLPDVAVPTTAPPAAPPVPAPTAEPVPPREAPAAVKPVTTSPAKNQALIDTYQRNAQAAFRRQDLATAISEWDKVLALDPNNELAKARRQEAIELDRRIKQIK
ncbi:MAG: LysM peptidoglycan-binding domain-containing protein [Burkholderiales bacterium]|jgi:tetratricopeptide (TPR) repeat protein|nr:LysM peptidoglycan-binding domain-containing protein [Burkholderiales bacterium]